MFEKRLDNAETNALFPKLKRLLSQIGITGSDSAIANAIGFISQAYEATAGLIGISLLTLAAYPDVYRQVAANFNLLDGFVAEVARFDPPVQNTRRFVAADGVVAGQAMQAGDAILVVLAAANRDPATNPQPDRFDLQRSHPTCFTFGLGVHACPGQALALTLTRAALRHLLTAGFDVSSLPNPVAYRPSSNTRIPIFAHA